jgi:amino acid efflux transporter
MPASRSNACSCWEIAGPVSRAVPGAGILALPALAASAAGPASLLAWLALLLFCVPVAATFAALGARYPDSG